MKIKSIVLSTMLMVSNSMLSMVSPDTVKCRGYISLTDLPPFERAVRCIKFYEGWHSRKDWPYIGYGHRVLPGEQLDWNITEQQADSILRSDLSAMCRTFRCFGRDSLLLATLAYNVGSAKLLGNEKYPKSQLLIMLESGNRDIHHEYLKYCHWDGKSIASIWRRRILELHLLYQK